MPAAISPTSFAELKPEVCFNALHGRWGEDGCVQGLLELLSIPYTHSGVLASAVAMHKEQAKDVMRAVGVPVRRRQGRDAAPRPPEPRAAAALRPQAGRRGLQRRRLHRARGPRAPAAGARPIRPGPIGEDLLAERFMPGRELTCAVMGDRALGIIEIVPAETLGFYDYEAKYAPGGSRHMLPAPVSSNVYELVQKLTLTAHKALGCRGVSRADFRFDDTPGGSGEMLCLEVNTQPGMTQTSLVPELAAHAGLSFAELVSWMVEEASCSR